MIVVAGHMICHMICSQYPTTRTRPPSSGPRYVAILPNYSCYTRDPKIKEPK